MIEIYKISFLLPESEGLVIQALIGVTSVESVDTVDGNDVAAEYVPVQPKAKMTFFIILHSSTCKQLFVCLMLFSGT